ncbi:MAG: FecR family protein [Mangrovibacterium sp.]
MKLMDREKLFTYIKGEIKSDQEIHDILGWIEQSDANQQEYTELKNLWVFTGLVQRQETANKGRSQLYKTIDFQKVLLWISKNAAVFLVSFLLGAFTLYLINQNRITNCSKTFNEIVVPYGERSVLYLYDGTKVWLNSGTTLKYPVTFKDNERKVFVDGEAFFEVAKRKKQPFIVQADQLDIKVYGTRFNVCAYHNESRFYVTLEEGSVKAEEHKNHTGLLLTPGKQAIFNRRTNQLTQTTVNPEFYSSWKENKLRFQDATFEEVLKKMERWYDIDIHMDPAINLHEHFTMTIKTESLREMLNLLSKTTAINYEINEDKVFISKP